jgi:pyruvate/2-oxoglutarate dehydrogenase complex dihydrolipoamide acyltransferase (E2) component
MPALSPTMEEGTLAKWLVKEGDTVASGDVIAEIETDKATMEFEAVDEGVIGKILVAEGTEGVKVNAPIAVLLEEGEERRRTSPAAGNGRRRRLRVSPAPSPRLRPPRRRRHRRPRPRRSAPQGAAHASSPRRWRGGSPRKRGSTSRRSRAPVRMAGS